MDLNSKTNLFFRLVLILSFFPVLWFPDFRFSFILPLVLLIIDKHPKGNKVLVILGLLLYSALIYFVLNKPDLEQKIITSFVCLLVAFSDIISESFKPILKWFSKNKL